MFERFVRWSFALSFVGLTGMRWAPARPRARGRRNSTFRDAGKVWPVQGTRYWAVPRIEVRRVHYVFKAKEKQMNRTYRAVQVTQPGKLEVVERTLVEPSFGQVRIKVEACGVCHTDALTVEGGMPGQTYPRVPGHEAIGTIEAVGPGVQGWKTGQRVGVGYMGGHCGYCKSCRRGDFVNCQNQPISGVHSDGGYAEMIIAQASGLAAIPDDLLPTEAAPLLCAGLTPFNGLRNSKARQESPRGRSLGLLSFPHN